MYLHVPDQDLTRLLDISEVKQPCTSVSAVTNVGESAVTGQTVDERIGFTDQPMHRRH